MTVIEKRIQAIADRWFIKEPLLFMTLMSHQVVPNKGLRHAMRCGQGRIEYCCDNDIEQLQDRQLEENLKAEIVRILLRHPYRRYNGKKAAAYVASNITLNENYTFRELKYKVSDFWTKYNFQKQNFEFYYREILKLSDGEEGRDQTDNGKEDLSQPDTDNMDNNAPAQASDADNTDNNASAQAWDADNTDNNASAQASDTGDMDNHTPAQASNTNEDNNKSQNQPTDENDMLEQNAALWEENDYIEQQIKEIIEWANSNMAWGSIPGNLVQTLIASLKPEIDYRKVLSAFRATVLSSDKMLTRFKPSRRYNFTYMGKKSRFTTQLLIGVDVSGSISDNEIRTFYAAINRFFKYGIQSIHVQQFDSELKGEPTTMKKAHKKITVHGRGGTCFEPVIDYFAAHQKTYDGLIIFTDGYAGIPDVKQHIARKMLWICNNKKSYEQHHGWMCRQGRCCWIS
ncbi:MAG: VWA-like domain-containing protein [Prevotellaceae bacterium]|jgi:predicted metal-dependent peptidase|nr:VWA-like domain-containing protein [Prevotellaceae bacterium]